MYAIRSYYALQSLSLYTAALQGTERSAERETICEEMSSAIQAMGTMLDVLLDIENLEDGHVRVEISEFPVADLVAAMLDERAENRPDAAAVVEALTQVV